jgi:D-alanine-D-alanine ligase
MGTAGPLRDDRGSLGIAGAVGLRAGGNSVVAGVAFGGPSPEHDVSILTGLQTVRALEKVHLVSGCHALYWSKTGDWYEVPTHLEAKSFIGGVPHGSRPLRLLTGSEGGFLSRKGRFAAKDEQLTVDVVVNCCHGGPGEDGTLQAALDLAGLPYTGPTVAGAALGMDKLAFGAMVNNAALLMLPRVPLTDGGSDPPFKGPYIVKPRFGGSSIGIEVVTDVATARALLRSNKHLRQGAVLEPYREDVFDLQVGVRGWPDLELSAIERPLRHSANAAGGEILGYSDKYAPGEGMAGAIRELPAKLAPELEDHLRHAAREVAFISGLRGVARIDFLSDGEAVYVNEINTIPGSLAKYLWVDPPVSFSQLLLDMIGEALAKPSVRYSVAGADGSILGSAGSIAGKLD